MSINIADETPLKQTTDTAKAWRLELGLSRSGFPGGVVRFVQSSSRTNTCRRSCLPVHFLAASGRGGADVEALITSLASKHGRKYSLESVRLSLEAILQQGISTTLASEMYGINRSTLQFYLKKLNVVRRRWKNSNNNANA